MRTYVTKSDDICHISANEIISGEIWIGYIIMRKLSGKEAVRANGRMSEYELRQVRILNTNITNIK